MRIALNQAKFAINRKYGTIAPTAERSDFGLAVVARQERRMHV
jgi:hypothetical protein